MSASTRRANKNRASKRGTAGQETVRNNDRANVMSHYKKLSADWTHEILYSLWLCVVLVLQIRTRSLRPKTILEYSERETRLAMSKTICAPDTSSLKPGSGATEGVLD